MLLVSIYVMFLLLHVYDNGSAVLRVDKSIHARLSPQDSALVGLGNPDTTSSWQDYCATWTNSFFS